MSRMVQCPKCRAILQEPPPGNPYYKCGSCFTVLQAKHATGGNGPQRPVGEDIPGQGIKNIPRRQVRPVDDGPDDSVFRRQKTLPSRLDNKAVDGDEDANQENGHEKQEDGTADIDTSSFTRQRTMPSRLPHAPRQEPLPSRASGANRGGLASRSRGQASDDSVLPGVRQERGRAGLGRGGQEQGRAAHRTPPDDGPMDASAFRRQKTLPARVSSQEATKESQQPGNARQSQSTDDDDSGRGSEIRRLKTLSNKAAMQSGAGPSLRRQTSERGNAQRSMGDEDLGRRDPDDNDNHDFMFRRQTTLPSKMPAGEFGDVDDDEEDEEEERPVYGRQKTLPSRLQENDGKGQGMKQIPSRHRAGKEVGPGQYMPQKSKQDVVIPARLQHLLSRKQPGGAGTLDNAAQGVQEKRLHSALKNGDHTNGRTGRQKPEGPEARQALREALLSGGRGGSHRSESDSASMRSVRSGMTGSGRKSDGGGLGNGVGLDDSLRAGDIQANGEDSSRSGNRGLASDASLKHRRRMSDPVDPVGGKQSPTISPPHHVADLQHRRHMSAGPGGPMGGESKDRRSLSRQASFDNRSCVSSENGPRQNGELDGDGRQAEQNEDETMSRNSEDTTVEHSDFEEDWDGEDDDDGTRSSYIRGVPLQTRRRSEREDRRVAAGDLGGMKKSAVGEQRAPKNQPFDGKGGLPMLPAPDAPQVVQCQHCTQMLAVPPNLPPSKKGIQKLRCGKCLQVSSFTAYSAAAALDNNDDSGSEASSLRSQNRTRPRPIGQGPYQDEESSLSGGQSVSGSNRTTRGQPLHDDRASDSTRERQRASGLQGAGMQRRGPQGPPGRQVDEYRRRVTVNGLQVPDWVLEKAEERAGPIHPGDYWYDSRAGFWGVLGGPCLGIIPPGIQEIDTAMPRDSAGGQTRVLVNGRELHKRDLELLRRRGLADTPNKSYIIDIYGRVIDEQTGAELRGLGKLAPSLEDRRRGGGMFVP